jgi:hypothetical protein
MVMQNIGKLSRISAESVNLTESLRKLLKYSAWADFIWKLLESVERFVSPTDIAAYGQHSVTLLPHSTNNVGFSMKMSLPVILMWPMAITAVEISTGYL